DLKNNHAAPPAKQPTRMYALKRPRMTAPPTSITMGPMFGRRSSRSIPSVTRPSPSIATLSFRYPEDQKTPDGINVAHTSRRRWYGFGKALQKARNMATWPKYPKIAPMQHIVYAAPPVKNAIIAAIAAIDPVELPLLGISAGSTGSAKSM